MKKSDLKTWAELLQLVARMTLAAVEMLGEDDEVDFEKVKIGTTPEEALRRARADSESTAT